MTPETNTRRGPATVDHSGMSLAQNGERLFTTLGCANACHSGERGGAGAKPCGRLYGAKLALANGG